MLAFTLYVPVVRAQSSGQARSLSAAQEEPAAFPVSFWLTYSQFVGQGTLVFGPSFNPYVLSDLNAWLQLRWRGFRLQASQEVFLELTQSDTTTRYLQPQAADTALQLAYDVDLPWGLGLTANANASVPLSLTSRASGSLGGYGVSLQGKWTAGTAWPTLWAVWGATYNAIVPQLADRFGQTPVIPLDIDGARRIRPQSCIRRSSAELGQYACTALPSAGFGSATVGLSWTFLDGLLTASAWANIVSALSAYVGPDDKYTPEGSPTGLFLNNTTTGVTSLSLAPTDWLSLSVGTWSFQPLLTADGKFYRFVFWDFIAFRDNWSTAYASVAVGF